MKCHLAPTALKSLSHTSCTAHLLKSCVLFFSGSTGKEGMQCSGALDSKLSELLDINSCFPSERLPAHSEALTTFRDGELSVHTAWNQPINKVNSEYQDPK